MGPGMLNERHHNRSRGRIPALPPLMGHVAKAATVAGSKATVCDIHLTVLSSRVAHNLSVWRDVHRLEKGLLLMAVECRHVRPQRLSENVSPHCWKKPC